MQIKISDAIFTSVIITHGLFSHTFFSKRLLTRRSEIDHLADMKSYTGNTTRELQKLNGANLSTKGEDFMLLKTK